MVLRPPRLAMLLSPPILTVCIEQVQFLSTVIKLTSDVSSASESENAASPTGATVSSPGTGIAVITVASCDDTSCSYVSTATGVSYGYNDQTTYTTYYQLSSQESATKLQKTESANTSTPQAENGTANPNTSEPSSSNSVNTSTPEAENAPANPNTSESPSSNTVSVPSGSGASQTVAPAIVSNTINPSSSYSTPGSASSSPAVFEGSAQAIKPWTTFSLVALCAIFYL